MLGIALGAGLGAIWHFQFIDESRFQSTATVVMSGQKARFEFQIISRFDSSEERVTKLATEVVSILDRIAKDSRAFHALVADPSLTAQQRNLRPVQSALLLSDPLLHEANTKNISVEGWAENPIWKQVVIGGVIGLLLTILLMYIWEDVRNRISDDTPSL